MAGLSKNDEQGPIRADLRRVIGSRVQQLRLSLPESLSSLTEFAKRLGLSDSLLSRIESGQASLPLDVVERIADVAGCHPEVIMNGNAFPESGPHPFHAAGEFIQQAEGLGIDGLFPERVAGLAHLAPFAERMRRGDVYINSSSLRGLEQRSEHRFVKRLIEMGRNPHFKVQVIMTHPKLGARREYQERRPPGSIVREILLGINWCLNIWTVIPDDIRLCIASPSAFSIFLREGPVGRGLINPYPTMRQAFLSLAITVRSMPPDRGAEAVSVYDTYFTANFRDPWQDTNVTVGLEDGLRECLTCIHDKSEGSAELSPHREELERTLKNCCDKNTSAKDKTDLPKKTRAGQKNSGPAPGI